MPETPPIGATEIEEALRDAASLQCPAWSRAAIERIARMALTGADLAAALAAHPVLLPVTWRARRTTRAALRDGLAGPNGPGVAVFLTHAMLQLLTRSFQRRAIEQDRQSLVVSARTYDNVRTLALATAFPLSEVDALRLAQADHVFAVFDRPEIYRLEFPEVPGVPLIPPIVTGLEDPALQDESPERVVATLEDARWSCSNWFRCTAIVHALDIAAGRERFRSDIAGRIDFDEKLDAIRDRNDVWQDVSRRTAESIKVWLDHVA